MPNVLIATNLPTSSLGQEKQGGPAFREFLDQIPSAFAHSYVFTSNTSETQFINCKRGIFMQNIPLSNLLKAIHESSAFGRLFAYIIRQVVFFTSCIKFNYIREIDYFYAYEIEYVPALKALSLVYKKPLISRFQGTIIPEYPTLLYFIKPRYLPHIISLSIPSSLCIMTDDGTNGKKVVQYLAGKLQHNQKILFLRNGFRTYPQDDASYHARLRLIREKSANICLPSSNTRSTIKFIVVSRLVGWKRVEISLKIFEKIAINHKNVELNIIGSGPCESYLFALVQNNPNLRNIVTFQGALPHLQVLEYSKESHFLISSYKLSNLGNPLFEAMSYGCVPVTVANGTTGQVCTDRLNSIISSENDILLNSDKVLNVIRNPITYENISLNAFNYFYNNESSWSERLSKEFSEILSINHP